MILRTKYAGTLLTIVGIVGAAFASLGLYTWYLQNQLGNTRDNLRETQAQVVYLQQEREKTQRALERLVSVTSDIRMELSIAREQARKDEEYQEWAPGQLPQIVIDTLRRPE